MNPLPPDELIHNRVAFVTGCHRSGSSWLMRLLMAHPQADLLYFGPDPMMLPPSNEALDGYQELRPIVNANTDMIHKARGSVHHPKKTRELYPPTSVQPTVLSLLASAAGRALVLKDPRFVATIGAWTYWLKNHRVVYLRREPARVVRSLVFRRGMTQFEAQTCFDTHVKLATDTLPADDRTLFVHYNDLIADRDKGTTETIDMILSHIVS